MAKESKAEKKRAQLNYKKGLKLGLITIVSLLVIFLIIFGIYSVAYSKKSYANVFVGAFDVGGKTRSDVQKLLEQQSEEYLTKEIKLHYLAENGSQKDYAVAPTEIGLQYDIEKSVNNVMNVGRDGQIGHELWQQLKSLFVKQSVNMEYSVNNEALDQKISSIAKDVDIPEKDFSLKYDGEGRFILMTERETGKRINQENIITVFAEHIASLDIEDISFKAEIFEPKISQSNAEKALTNANKILSYGEMKIKMSDKEAIFDIDTIASVIASKTQENDLVLTLDQEKLRKQIQFLATQVDTESKNAVFKFEEGKVSAFQASEAGKKLDQEKALSDLSAKILGRAKSEPNKEVVLVVLITKPEVDSAEISKYGLKELVATGTTSFAGSPTNRIHNIRIGLNSINGTLLKPGEEFSTLGRLGKIDGTTGYLPELVIKDNKTVPEFGGGLCQVSTTLFRAALNSGMEITARNNHSYRVSYYEPPIGMDATIYDPAPDFKFKNNYNSHILIQGKITGTKITFEFYGTKDSRVVEVGTPVAYDYVNPPAPVETPTDTLPEGTRQQLAKSHQGASAKFHYKVSREGAILQERDFVSKYVALPEKWLVGTAPVAPAPVSEPAPVANTEDPVVTPTQ